MKRYRAGFEADVAYCSRRICRELRCNSDQFSDLRYLCNKHSTKLLPDPNISLREGGKSCEDCILICPCCTLAQYREIIIHELVHRLADTARWEYLNKHIQGWRYNREEFIEAVARTTGKLFAAQFAHWKVRDGTDTRRTRENLP